MYNFINMTFILPEMIFRLPNLTCFNNLSPSAETKENLVIRICVLENMDSQCGRFKFEQRELTGCILTCDNDGCNAAPTSSAARGLLIGAVAIFAVMAGPDWRLRFL